MFVIQADTIQDFIQELIAKMEGDRVSYLNRLRASTTLREQGLYNARISELRSQIGFLENLHIESSTGEVIKQGK